MTRNLKLDFLYTVERNSNYKFFDYLASLLNGEWDCINKYILDEDNKTIYTFYGINHGDIYKGYTEEVIRGTTGDWDKWSFSSTAPNHFPDRWDIDDTIYNFSKTVDKSYEELMSEQ